MFHVPSPFSHGGRFHFDTRQAPVFAKLGLFRGGGYYAVDRKQFPSLERPRARPAAALGANAHHFRRDKNIQGASAGCKPPQNPVLIKPSNLSCSFTTSTALPANFGPGPFATITTGLPFNRPSRAKSSGQSGFVTSSTWTSNPSNSRRSAATNTSNYT